MNDQIKQKTQELIDLLNNQELDEKVDSINFIRKQIHKNSPFKNEPVDLIQWVRQSSIQANSYNPNQVAPPEMELLETSILNDGYTQPIVTWPIGNNQSEVIDGFHRSRVGKESKVVNQRIHGYLPIVSVGEERTGKNDRVASTIRHNRARGKHAVGAMSDIVVELKKRNWSEKRIGKELGMDEDEVLRLCQISGLSEAFENEEFSEAWEAKIFEGDEEVSDVDFEDNQENGG